MGMELKISNPVPDTPLQWVTWNAEELADEVNAKIGYYKNLVYTEAQIVEAKTDRATLNKLLKAARDKDREIKDYYLAPYTKFHAELNTVLKPVTDAVDLIDRQVKGFEDDQREKKRADVEGLFKGKGFQPWVSLEKIWNPKWLNKTYSLKQVDDDLNKIMYKIGEDIFLINRQGDGVQAALAEYKRTLNIRDAIDAAQKFVQAKHAEESANRHADMQTPAVKGSDIDAQIPGQVTLAGFMNAPEEPAPVPASASTPAPTPEPPVTVPEKKEIFFKAYVTREQLMMLNAFLKENGIPFRQIKNLN